VVDGYDEDAQKHTMVWPPRSQKLLRPSLKTPSSSQRSL